MHLKSNQQLVMVVACLCLVSFSSSFWGVRLVAGWVRSFGGDQTRLLEQTLTTSNRNCSMRLNELNWSATSKPDAWNTTFEEICPPPELGSESLPSNSKPGASMDLNRRPMNGEGETRGLAPGASGDIWWALENVPGVDESLKERKPPARRADWDL